ncbi:MAG: Stp1/IreP family PP2C-type Ser/Thr phosphatase [Firmicutes bacterium]|nr:Stp1/IreP family PP2C-type Ser/Thr phosphatase [Bacillota bacterium]
MRTVLRTDVGKARKINEDAAYAGGSLCIVCDGMGGHQAGEVASNQAVDVITAALSSEEPSVCGLLDAVAKANEHVYRNSLSDKRLTGMGTTLTMLWMDAGQVILAQIGDSRAYLLRGGVLRQCTHDHSVVAEMVRMGSITPEEARTHPRRNLITRSLGTDPRVEADIFEVSRRPGDRWLICSDGLTDHVTDAEIAAILAGDNLYEAADTLLALALDRGGSDNITLILLEDEGGGDTP